MTYDEVLESAMAVINEFFKETAANLETCRNIIVNEHGYKDISGDRVCWEDSNSILYPAYWSPVYLSQWYQCKDDDEIFISITIILKDYWDNQAPKKEYSIYGCKFYKVVDHLKKYHWLGIYSIECPSENYKRIDQEGYTEVINPSHFGFCKFIYRSLWEVKDKQAITDFVRKIIDL